MTKSSPMKKPIFQHPLAYLLGLEGLALMRGWAGDFDEEFTRNRLDEVRRLLHDPLLTSHPGIEVTRGRLDDGYTQWAPDYDSPNRLFDLDEPFVYGVVDDLPIAVALDAGCGTGRFAQGLAHQGHEVIGVDGNVDMLRVARRRVPSARFVLGDLHALPVADASVDLVVCALALSHVPSLEPVMGEFARVLVPGGHLLISDVHHELIFRGSVVMGSGPDGRPCLVPTYRHTPGAFLRVSLNNRLALRGCEEPRQPVPAEPKSEPLPELGAADLGPWQSWPWSLMDLLPTARDAAWDIPLVINWHFQREAAATQPR
jgi:SAM-dependent methyltransferase